MLRILVQEDLNFTKLQEIKDIFSLDLITFDMNIPDVILRVTFLGAVGASSVMYDKGTTHL